LETSLFVRSELIGCCSSFFLFFFFSRDFLENEVSLYLENVEAKDLNSAGKWKNSAQFLFESAKEER